MNRRVTVSHLPGVPHLHVNGSSLTFNFIQGQFNFFVVEPEVPPYETKDLISTFANRPFYRYGGHIEFIRLKEYYGMPRGHEHDQYTRSV